MCNLMLQVVRLVSLESTYVILLYGVGLDAIASMGACNAGIHSHHLVKVACKVAWKFVVQE